MPTNDEIRDAYIERTLAVIRGSNGESQENMALVAAMIRDIRAFIFANYPAPSGRVQREVLIAELMKIVLDSYRDLATRQAANARQLLWAEAAFARRAAGFLRAPSDAALSRALAALLVMGNPVQLNWTQEGSRVASELARTIRTAWDARQRPDEFISAVVGTGRVGSESGGILGRAVSRVPTMTEADLLAASSMGRQVAAAANRASYYRWFAILDSKVCPDCGMRAGKLYDSKLEPVGHSIPAIRRPPLHYNCRCILVPEKYDTPPKNSGPKGDSFERYLSGLSDSAASRILGRGRAQMWRSGAITLHALVGQDGMVMPLKQLLNLD